MKKYRIWLTNDQIIEITAKSIELDYHHFKPSKISFVDDWSNTIAEFYCNMIYGWAEINPKLNSEGEDEE